MQFPAIAQIGLCPNDLPQAKNFYTEVFGFKDTLTKLLSGPRVAAVQELEQASVIVNWLIGGPRFLQLEMFQHIVPTPAPLPDDWRVSDYGWSRFGITVWDFDACLARLADRGIALISGPTEILGARRASFRDPFAGIIVEVIEGEAGAAGSDGEVPLPALSHVSVTVENLAIAREFWVGDLGFEEDASFSVDPEREKLWGLPEPVEATGFRVVRNGMALEVMAYANPEPRRFAGRRLCDQGIMNIGVGFRERDALAAMVERLEARGYTKSVPLGPGVITATYFRGPENVSVELFACPKEVEDKIGFVDSGVKSIF